MKKRSMAWTYHNPESEFDIETAVMGDNLD